MRALPEQVRARVVTLGAQALEHLNGQDVPALLRPIARFAQAKRARLGGAAIAAAVETDAAFRRHVLEVAARAYPGIIDAVRDGVAPAAAEPVDLAVVTYLLRPDGWEDALDDVVTTIESSALTSQQAREAAVTGQLREQLEATRTSARETRDRLKSELDRVKDENSTLRHKLRDTRDQLAAAVAERDGARAEAEAAAAKVADAERSADAELRRLRARLDEVETALEDARRSGREDRGLGTARITLLLDTLADAAAGLRRELALPASTVRPADTVAAAAPGTGDARARAQTTDDPRRFEELLAMPRAHLLVDGYNVTKTAWASTPLESQRTRLVRGLAVVAARSGAEVTCVFDGSDVSTPPSVVAAQGVRVLFSSPGQTADELIDLLIRAEPEGRALVVVSSDREVADGARQRGAYSVESSALIATLR